jgi:hypothetical protein
MGLKNIKINVFMAKFHTIVIFLEIVFFIFQKKIEKTFARLM